MTKNKRVAFFISDGTGITAGSLGGLLAHFPETEFEQIRIPYTNNSEKVEDAQKRIANAKLLSDVRPVVIMTIGDSDLRNELKQVMSNMTTLIITNRVPTIELCDEVIFLENGKVRGQGSHNKLIEEIQSYKSLFLESQTSGSKNDR